MMKVNIALDGTDDQSKFDNVICSFHSGPITGMDICIRKQLVVTCSKDRTIRIWNYALRTLEICFPVTEEALAVAFHPSGFHIVVALLDKILMMNVLSKSLNTFKSIPAKGCKEVRFSNGGHYFTVAMSGGVIQIHNFFTGEVPFPTYFCKAHQQKVRSIDWWEDDMGFTSCGQDGMVFFFDLIIQKETGNRMAEKEYC
jgi:WD40 repeat protein